VGALTGLVIAAIGVMLGVRAAQEWVLYQQMHHLGKWSRKDLLIGGALVLFLTTMAWTMLCVWVMNTGKLLSLS
jgi:hypothetical protein